MIQVLKKKAVSKGSFFLIVLGTKKEAILLGLLLLFSSIKIVGLF
jgi:hypothetical protein